MAQISNLNVQIDQSRVSPDNGRLPTSESHGVDARAPSVGIRSGTLVQGQVLSQNADGSYTVRLDAQGGQGSQTLMARATVNLVVGEHFRAVWDVTDKIPVLRLTQGELSLLTKLPASDRELATALLSRGMSLSGEAMQTVREAWRRMGGLSEDLSPLLELWARKLPMSAENVRLLSWYAGLSAEQANALWENIRKELKARSRRSENTENILDALRALKEGEGDEEIGEIARFLKAHSLLLRAPRQEVDPALLSAPLWPGCDDLPHMLARVFVGHVHEGGEGERGYWQVGFSVEGSRLGFIGGDVESDGRSYNLNLHAEQPETCELLKFKRHSIRAELKDIPLALLFIGISRVSPDAMRGRFLNSRGLDITV